MIKAIQSERVRTNNLQEQSVYCDFVTRYGAPAALCAEGLLAATRVLSELGISDV
jgi:hypothetical protein